MLRFKVEVTLKNARPACGGSALPFVAVVVALFRSPALLRVEPRQRELTKSKITITKNAACAMLKERSLVAKAVKGCDTWFPAEELTSRTPKLEHRLATRYT